jgi:hypothetical protein
MHVQERIFRGQLMVSRWHDYMKVGRRLLPDSAKSRRDGNPTLAHLPVLCCVRGCLEFHGD